MFKISIISLFSIEGERFDYHLSSGLNYFRGKNNSGKTVFWGFIDYMFGSTNNINDKEWFRDTLSHGEMLFDYNGHSFMCRRSLDPEKNYFSYADEDWGDSISLDEYRERMASIFASGASGVHDLHEFCDESLTYRTFTMFNFLGETGLGLTSDFLQRSHDNIKYSVKLNGITNFLFNTNIEAIHRLKIQIDELKKEITDLESALSTRMMVTSIVNNNLGKLSNRLTYTGRNANEIRAEIREIRQFNDKKESSRESIKNHSISELEVTYNQLDEQIKKYGRMIDDSRLIGKDNKNRLEMLRRLQAMIEEKPDYAYLIQPLTGLLDEVEKSISFGSYITNDHTLEELKKRRTRIKQMISDVDMRYRFLSVDEKMKAVAVIEEYLDYDVEVDDARLKEAKTELRRITEEMRMLQNRNDNAKINAISNRITEMYMSARDISDIVSVDALRAGFRIQYQKRGNNLQPQIEDMDSDSGISNFYVGSLARHTLMQLCGYLSFLDMIVGEKTCPIIPMFVVDHMSKPFDEKNRKAIGRVFTEFYSKVKKDAIQIIMFEDKRHDELMISPDMTIDLVSEGKTGFNPFYTAPIKDDEN